MEKLKYSLEKQLSCWQKIVKIDPNDVKSWNVLQLLFHKIGKYDQVLEASGKALAINPNNTILIYDYTLKNLGYYV